MDFERESGTELLVYPVGTVVSNRNRQLYKLLSSLTLYDCDVPVMFTKIVHTTFQKHLLIAPLKYQMKAASASGLDLVSDIDSQRVCTVNLQSL